MVKLIVCIDLLGNIGKNNDLLFHIPRDLKFFRDKTTGNTIVMGYNTWESLPKKPLPNRFNIVLTRDEEKSMNIDYNTTAVSLNSLNFVIKAKENTERDIYIIGGVSIYNQSIDMDIIDEAYITLVNTIVEDADVSINIDKLEEQLPKHELLDSYYWNDYEVTVWRFFK